MTNLLMTLCLVQSARFWGLLSSLGFWEFGVLGFGEVSSSWLYGFGVRGFGLF